MLPRILDEWWCSEFLPGKPEDGIDYVSRDGMTAVEIQQATYGTRGLATGIMRLAAFLAEHPSVVRGCLVLHRTSLSWNRLKAEWQRSKCVLRSDIVHRLAIIAIEKGQTWIDPQEPFMRRVADAFRSGTVVVPQDQPHRLTVRSHAGEKFYEVLKVLLIRWLGRQGPIALGKLATAVGCSYPTVRKSLQRVSLRHALRHTSKRSVELTAFPHEAWNELLALSRSLRNTLRFHDRSGDRPAPENLLRRLERIHPPHLAIGGVIAARFWHSDFDLHGTPRLDLMCHAPAGNIDLGFVPRLDPALSLTEDATPSPVLVIHPLVRAESQFIANTNGAFPWADPVETALDLCELSLKTQADRLLTHLRPEARLA